MKQKEIDAIKTKIHRALTRLSQLTESYKNGKSKEIIELRSIAQGERTALYSVLDALNGNDNMLDQLSTGLLCVYRHIK